MKTIFLSMLVCGFLLMSCKKEAQKTGTNSGTTVPDTVHEVPVPAPIDTLVAAPTSGTASSTNDSAKIKKR